MTTKAEALVGPSCLTRASDDEPVFVLRAKDPIAADVVRIWAVLAEKYHGEVKAQGALIEAAAMDMWRADEMVRQADQLKKDGIRDETSQRI